MTLPVAAFLQRWLLHVPVPQTRVVRSYGLYHHAHPEALAHCRAALGQPPVEPPPALDWQTVCAQRGEAHPEQEELFLALHLRTLAEQLGNRVLNP
jgi:Putative transposase